MSSKVTLIDYGMGNIYSVTRAFEDRGSEVFLTNDPAKIRAADRLILPGVGAFGDGMAGLKKLNLVEAIWDYARKERPFLGICLGMQMMLSTAEEFGHFEGIGLIDGVVAQISNRALDGARLKVPHIGWNRLEKTTPQAWERSPLQGTAEGTFCYFVHSFEARPKDPKHVLAVTRYGQHPVTAVIGRDHMWGCQFHPERSGPEGLKIVENFLAI